MPGGTLERLVARLQNAGYDLHVADLLDAFWLASRGRGITLYGAAPAPAPAPAPGDAAPDLPTPDIRPPPTTSADDGPAPPGSAPDGPKGEVPVYGAGRVAPEPPTVPAAPVALPAGQPLQGRLQLARALRPLRTRRPSPAALELDELATVGASAAYRGILYPVFRPVPEPWFDAHVVLEDDPAIDLWRDTLGGFCRLLEETGAFRRVESWRQRDAAGETEPGAGPSRAWLEGPTGVRVGTRLFAGRGLRRLIFFATHGGSVGWLDGRYARVLAPWARTSSLVILDLFGRDGEGIRWPRGTLGEPHGTGAALEPGAVTADLEVTTYWWRAPPDPACLVPVPGVPLTPAGLGDWALTLMGRGRRCPVFLLDPAPPPGANDTADAAADDPELAVDLLREASPAAFRLAVALARSAFTIPVARVVQETQCGGAAPQSDLAAVLLSGLVHARSPAGAEDDPNERWFEFHDEARRVLLRSLRESDALAIGEALEERVSRYLERIEGRTIRFRALVPDAQGRDRLPAWARPFARFGLALMGTGGAGTERQRVEEPVVTSADREPEIFPAEMTTADFECFLAHNSRDKRAVRALAARLTAAGVRVWLDEEQLVPGRSSQPLLVDGIARSATAAVLIGADGPRSWENEEMQALLSPAVAAGKPVIPVLLPGAPGQPELPSFLHNRIWVDLREGLDGAGFECLLWGIRGQPPGEQPTPVGPDPAPSLPRLRIFLASPGDVADERRLARDRIEQLPRLPDLAGRVAIELIAWDKPGGGAPLLATMNPQEAIATHCTRPSACDIVVVIMGWRLGTPLDPAWQTKPDGSPYRSGTEWEYLHALAVAEARGTPALLVYRKQGAPNPAFDAPDFEETRRQWEAVKSFFAEFQNPDGSARRAWTAYDTPTDLAERLSDDLQAVAIRLLPALTKVPTAAASATPAAPAWTRPPYPGLHALRDADAPIFCGRGRETDDLIRLLGDPARRCLTVVGASGSGKSSLIWAGLLPHLAGNALPGSGDWRWVRFTPAEFGDDPLLALATALAHRFAHCRWEPAPLAARLKTPTGLAEVVDQALAGAPDWAQLLLFVDQLEEVFRLLSAAVRDSFIDRLTAAAALPRVRLLATLRADFVAELPVHPGLADLYNQGNYLLTPPLQPARVRMVVEPARRVGRDLEPGLADRIVADTGDQPGALPLMAYALERLYARDQDRPVFTHESYEAGGGVRGAIATQAERVFAEFAAAHGESAAAAALAALFSELVRVEDADAPVTRRRAGLAGLGASDGGAARLAECLVQARLLVKDGPAAAGAPGQPVIDVAHEALLSGWDRLATWIHERREDLRLRDLLRRSVADWEGHGCRHKFLMRSDRVPDVYAALERLGQAASSREQAYLDPARRAAWLLARDTAAWLTAGRGAAYLWGAERFTGFADLPPGSLPVPTGEQRTFLADSFAACLMHHAADPLVRAACGAALGAVGDPRFDPDAWSLPADPTLGFREVPAGSFQMGSDPQRQPKGWADEEPQHEQNLPAYYLARWPVTVAQFAAFVADSGHQPGESDAWRGHPNHPVVYVSWYDACAYCAWHGERLRAIAAERLAVLASDPVAHRFWQGVAAGHLQPGLPSEPEWEKATRGTDGRIYACGNTIRPDLANYKDTGLKSPCAVGCFPSGAGPYGGEDQTGNVWEWTRSLWGHYPYKAHDGREDRNADDALARVLRGGAFGLGKHDCRSAARNRNFPLNRSGSGGFRVVWSALFGASEAPPKAP